MCCNHIKVHTIKFHLLFTICKYAKNKQSYNRFGEEKYANALIMPCYAMLHLIVALAKFSALFLVTLARTILFLVT